MIALRPADENERIINVETDGPAVRLVDFVPHAWAFNDVGQAAPLIGFTLAPLWIHAQIEPLPRARNTPSAGPRLPPCSATAPGSTMVRSTRSCRISKRH